MPRKDCNIIHSSEELEKSYLLQKSKTEVDEHEKNLQAKGSAQSSLSVFPGLDRKKTEPEEYAEKQTDDFYF